MTTVYSIVGVCVLNFARVSCDVGGYHYPKPVPPVQFDEVSTPVNIYLPPIIQDLPPIIQEPPLIPTPTYLPPVQYPPVASPPDPDVIYNDDDTVVVQAPPALYSSPATNMRVLSMACVLNSSFKSLIHIDGRSSQLPVIEDGIDNCMAKSASGSYLLDLEGNKRMTECGVRRCAGVDASKHNMCIVLRIPTVRGLKLPEDSVVTLKCSPQDAIAAHTKHIRLGPTSISSKGRANNAIVASGGGQKGFESRMVLLRKSPGSNNFDQPLQAGSVVLLGEEIVLRATVEDGDGWKYSRMGPVVVRSGSTKKSTTLVEENGCRSPGMQNICPFQPRQLTPLDNILHFRAFLFQDSANGDNMVLSVRMVGCLNRQDGFQNGICDGSPQRAKRYTRNLNEKGQNTTTNWESQLAFRVQMPLPHDEKLNNLEDSSLKNSKEFLLVVSMFGLCLLLTVTLLALFCKRKQI